MEKFIKDWHIRAYKMGLEDIVGGVADIAGGAIETVGSTIGGMTGTDGLWTGIGAGLGLLIGAIGYYKQHRRNLTKNYYGSEFVEKQDKEKVSSWPMVVLGGLGYGVLYNTATELAGGAAMEYSNSVGVGIAASLAAKACFYKTYRWRLAENYLGSVSTEGVKSRNIVSNFIGHLGYNILYLAVVASSTLAGGAAGTFLPEAIKKVS